VNAPGNGPGPAIVLWTGGKDSYLALQSVRAHGYQVRGLVTFAPERAEFLAHPLPFIKLQAEALGIEHCVYTVVEPCHANYELQLAAALRDFDAETVVTGDIAEVAGHPNLIAEICDRIGVACERPLWGRDRVELLAELQRSGAEAVISCLRSDLLPTSWLGRTLDARAISELQHLGIDPCGENGEYHTLVCDAREMHSRIAISGWQIGQRDTLAYFGAPQFAAVAKVAA
jgi:diphthine-ammonia ligase